MTRVPAAAISRTEGDNQRIRVQLSPVEEARPLNVVFGVNFQADISESTSVADKYYVPASAAERLEGILFLHPGDFVGRVVKPLAQVYRAVFRLTIGRTLLQPFFNQSSKPASPPRPSPDRRLHHHRACAAAPDRRSSTHRESCRDLRARAVHHVCRYPQLYLD